MNTRAPAAVLALVPSIGHGGGIEGYVTAVLESLRAADAAIITLALSDTGGHSGFSRKIRFLLDCVKAARSLRRAQDIVVLCFHSGLLPSALLCRWLLPAAKVRLFAHGREIWGLSTVERALIRWSDVQLTTVSDFSAGALLALRPASVLHPSLPAHRYELFRRTGSAPGRQTSNHLRLLSVFRLDEFEDKGGPTLIAAVEQLRAQGRDIFLTLAGAASHFADLPLVTDDRSQWLSIVQGPSDTRLSELYAEANIFVLASRLAARPVPQGEGFGIVLIEAALTGLPTIVPSGGGSHAAFLEGITGIRPADDTPEALARVILWLADHPRAALQMGQNGHQWATAKFDPEKYRQSAANLVLSFGPQPAPALGLMVTVATNS